MDQETFTALVTQEGLTLPKLETILNDALERGLIEESTAQVMWITAQEEGIS